jgi:hypothetical protein
MTETIIGYDAESQYESVLPVDMQAAGYDTQVGGGTGIIAWTAEQYASHVTPYPAVHIVQDPAASDYTWDIVDMEAGAFTAAELPAHITLARLSFNQAARPGQRWPGVYCSFDNLPAAINSLHAANLIDVPFAIADYSVLETEAVARVQDAGGSYPVVMYQFNDTAFSGLADTDVFSVPWLTTISHTEVPDMPNGQLQNEAFIPVTTPAKSLILYRDFLGTAERCMIRVAVHSAAKGYVVTILTLDSAVPVILPFTEPDTDAVSIVRASGPAPVGYAIV